MRSRQGFELRRTKLPLLSKAPQFWYKPYNGPKGRLQIGMQYSYLVKTAWVGYGTLPFTGALNSSTVAPKAIEKMWFTSFRYYLP